MGPTGWMIVGSVEEIEKTYQNSALRFFTCFFPLGRHHGLIHLFALDRPRLTRRLIWVLHHLHHVMQLQVPEPICSRAV